MTGLSSADAATVEKIAQNFASTPGPVIEILHGVQNALGYVPAESIAIIASVLNLSRAEIHGVVTFYHHFRSTPPGRKTIQVCRAEACQSMHGVPLEAHVKTTLGIDYHETTADGHFSLEPIYCLGNCACAPSIMIGDEIYGRVTPAVFDELIDEERASS